MTKIKTCEKIKVTKFTKNINKTSLNFLNQNVEIEYQLKNSNKKETHFQMLKSLELSKDNHKKLFKYEA